MTEALRHRVSNFGLTGKHYLSARIDDVPGGSVDDVEATKFVPEDQRSAKSDTTYLVFQHRGRDVLAVPKQSKAASLVGVAKYQPFTRKRRLYRMLTSGLIRIGASRLVAVTRANPVDKDFRFDFKSWQAELERDLGRHISHAIVTWPPETSRRRLYVHLLDANLRAFAFVKLAFTNDDHANLAVEAEALRAIGSLPFRKIRVPKLISHGYFGEVSHLVTEPLPAHAKPLKLTQDCDSSTLTAEYRGQRKRLTGAEIMSMSWWLAYTKALQPEHQAFHTELMRLLPLGAEMRRAHGDLGLANMVTDGECTWIFDWESCHGTAPTLADSIGFFMSFTLGKTQRDPMAHLTRILDRFLADGSKQQRLAVMMAVAFRHACNIPDAGSLMQVWAADSG